MPNESIQRYGTSACLIPLGKAPHYMGVELEVESGEIFHRVDQARVVLQILNQDSEDGHDFVICKRDASLENGFEICTRPATLEIQKQKWSKFFDVLNCSGGYARDRRGIVQNQSRVECLNSLDSQDTTTCGMHIHLSKLNQDGSPLMSQKQQKKLTVFFNASENLKFLQTIGQRGSFYGGGYDSSKTMRSEQMRRSEAVNFQNEYTAEIRIFIGTLREDHFYKNLEFAHAIKRFTRDKFLSWEKMTYGNFIQWVMKEEKRYPYLVRFIHQRFFKFADLVDLQISIGRKSLYQLRQLEQSGKRIALGYRLHFELSRLDEYPQIGPSSLGDRYSGISRRGSYNVASRIQTSQAAINVEGSV